MERSDSLIKLVSILIFAAAVVYIAFAFFGRNDTLLTVEAISDESRDSVATTGYLVRNEQLVRITGSDVAVTAKDGAKVAAGETIAIRYGTIRAMELAAQVQELELRIEQLTALKNGKTRDALADEEVLKLADCVASGELSDLYSISVNIDAYIISGTGVERGGEEAEILRLTEERDRLAGSAESDMVRIRSEAPGVFCQTTDGYEHVSPEDLADIRPSGIAPLFAVTGRTDNAVGKLVTDIRWYYVTTMDEKSAAKLKEGGTASVEFSRSYSAVLTMKVESVSPVENGKCAVVFSSASYMQDVADLREMTAEVVFQRRSGIRVPREAVHVDEDGKPFVYILEGLRAKKVIITMMRESHDYYVVAIETGGLRVRDQIIVRAENLYDGAVVAE